MPNIVWLRRDLRLYDHAALSVALSKSEAIQPVFVFDTEILGRFSDKHDRRLTFLAEIICDLNSELSHRGGGLLVLHGKASEIIPKLAGILGGEVFTAEDFEPDTRKRDDAVGKEVTLTLVKDHLIFAPYEVLKGDGTAFKVFTPYSKQWLSRLTEGDYAEYAVEDKGRYADITTSRKRAEKAGLNVIDVKSGATHVLHQIGYEPADISLWPVTCIRKKLAAFMQQKVGDYKDTRDMLAMDGTSRMSPYYRFGVVSVREAMRLAKQQGSADKYISELIWREFYAMILYHYPESASTEWNPKFRDKLNWRHDAVLIRAWKEGKTGYPVVDAAMRQLLETGWMHNRARMIVASFATKDLQMDWRIGEEHFAQHLMDYDMASNVGGWQWSASTGTDAQPWFRIFNPYLQSKKFDPAGEYIRRYVPELAHVKGDDIHNPPLQIAGDYPEPVVNHARAREQALAMFKTASD